jgi:hypothetical protein
MHPLNFQPRNTLFQSPFVYWVYWVYWGLSLLFDSLFYVSCLRNRSLCGRDPWRRAGCSRFGGLLPPSLLSHFPQKTIYQKPTQSFRVSISLYPLIRLIQTISQSLAPNDATIFNHTAFRQRLDGAFHPLLVPSPLCSSHLPSLIMRKIIRQESTIPRHSSAWGAQECKLWKASIKLCHKLLCYWIQWFYPWLYVPCPLVFYPRSSPPTWKERGRVSSWTNEVHLDSWGDGALIFLCAFSHSSIGSMKKLMFQTNRDNYFRHTDFVNCLGRLFRQLDHLEPPELHSNVPQHTTSKAYLSQQLLVSHKI